MLACPMRSEIGKVLLVLREGSRLVQADDFQSKYDYHPALAPDYFPGRKLASGNVWVRDWSSKLPILPPTTPSTVK